MKNVSVQLEIMVIIKTWNVNTPPLLCGRQLTVKNWQTVNCKKKKNDENTDERTTDGRIDNCQKWKKLPISNPKPDLHNINAQTNSRDIYSSYRSEKSTDGRTTDGQTQDQHETIITRHYHVMGYNNKKGKIPCICKSITIRAPAVIVCYFYISISAGYPAVVGVADS